MNGTITTVNDIDDTVLFTIPTAEEGASCPFLLPGLHRQVMNTGTTIVDAALIGYR